MSSEAFRRVYELEASAIEEAIDFFATEMVSNVPGVRERAAFWVVMLVSAWIARWPSHVETARAKRYFSWLVEALTAMGGGFALLERHARMDEAGNASEEVKAVTIEPYDLFPDIVQELLIETTYWFREALQVIERQGVAISAE